MNECLHVVASAGATGECPRRRIGRYTSSAECRSGDHADDERGYARGGGSSGLTLVPVGASNEATIGAGGVARSAMAGALTHNAVVAEQVVMDEQRPLGSCELPQSFMPAIAQPSEDDVTETTSGDGERDGAAVRDIEAMAWLGEARPTAGACV